jgi:endoglucanase
MNLARLASRWLLAMTAVALPAFASAGCLDGKPLRGVNMAGAEFNGTRMPGQVFKDYTYPTNADLQYFADLGATAIRLPFRWERLQRTLKGPLDPGELLLIRRVAETTQSRKMCLVLDLHNFGTYLRQKVGSDEVPVDAFVDFWLRMSKALPDTSAIAFGLMNEPAHMDLAVWGEASSKALKALRDAGDEHLVIVAGGAWSGAHDWMQAKKGGRSNAQTFADLRDPLDRLLIEVHQYADSDHSGSKADCMPADRMRATLGRVRDWAVENRQKLFLGEFATADSPACLETLQAMLESMREPPWAGWTYWAAGAWWGNKYIFNVHPIPGVNHGQVPLLQKEMQ